MPSLGLTPRGRLLFTVGEDALQPRAALVGRLESAFGRGSGHGLLELGFSQIKNVVHADERDAVGGTERAGAQAPRRAATANAQDASLTL